MGSNKNLDIDKRLIKVIRQLQSLAFFATLLVVVTCLYLAFFDNNSIITEQAKSENLIIASIDPSEEVKEDFWIAPDITTVSDKDQKAQLEYGKDLIANTTNYFGPNGKVKKNAINGMNCQNCHLDAGTKVFGNNYSAVFANYPKYRARSGAVEDINKRVNDCFERSLNGKTLDTNSVEMKAIVAYINFLGKDVPKDEKPKGSGFKDVAFLDRAIDPAKGKIVFEQMCVSCHQANGKGLLNEDKTAFTYPPLWGENSYNEGAGLFRMSNFAKYAKYNMPLGASHNSPQLTDEQAWDIAAFVNSQPHPKKNITKDWPHMDEKPFDHPFGPYADGFSEKEHKYGPFKPIKQKLEEMKKEKSKTKGS
jgi:thiosulfate dehydrogenase